MDIGKIFEGFIRRGNKYARRVVVVRRSRGGNRRTPSRGSKDRRWVQRAIRSPGALTRWMKRHREKVMEVTGVDPFTKKGEIRQLALIRLRKSDWYKRLSTRTKRRINLAITLERMRRG